MHSDLKVFISADCLLFYLRFFVFGRGTVFSLVLCCLLSSQSCLFYCLLLPFQELLRLHTCAAILRHRHRVAAVSSEPYRHTHTHTAFFLFWECHEHAQTWGLLIAQTPRCLPHGSSFLNIGSRCKAGMGQGPCPRGGST